MGFKLCTSLRSVNEFQSWGMTLSSSDEAGFLFLFFVRKSWPGFVDVCMFLCNVCIFVCRRIIHSSHFVRPYLYNM